MTVTQPTTMEAIRTAVLLWVRDITAREIVLKYDSELHKPTSPYVEVFIEQAHMGNGRVLTLEIVDDEPIETISTTTLITVTLNALGGDAMDAATRLRNSLYATNRYLDLYQILGLGSVESMQDLTSLETGHFKQRAELRISFYARVDDTFNSGYYDNLDVTVERE